MRHPFTGTTAIDSSSNGNNGTYVGSPTLGVNGLITNNIDKAATFDGSSQYVQIPYVASFNSTAISAEAWIFVTQTGAFQNAITRDTTSPATRQFQFRVTSANQLEVVIFHTSGSSNTSVTVPTTVTNGLHYVAFTYDDTDNVITVYLDDNTPTTGVLGGNIQQPSGGDVTIAARIDTTVPFVHQYLGGTVDEAAFYNYRLTSTQIQRHYNKGA